MSRTTHLVDFHSHSTHSDGLNTPKQLARMMVESGVEYWALTDHDTCSGVQEAQEAAESLGIQCVSGIEISAWSGRSIHVLGLGVKTNTLLGFAERRRAMREERIAEMVERLNQLHVPVDVADVLNVAAGASIGRPHLARALVSLGVVASVSEAFDRFIGADCPAYIETTWPSVTEAIQLIHSAHGIAIIAHPGKDQVGLPEIALWSEAGLDGLEILHPKHSAQESVFFEGIADSFGIFKLASTDYHGAGPNDLTPGVEMPRRWLEPVLNRLGLN